jgi:mRNA-degrading endonuclease RelE of RelBE toxin-antitoxin system
VKNWTVKLTAGAKKNLRELEEGPKRDAAELLHDLEEDPFSVPAIQLRSHAPGTMRARFHGTYRMVYQISKAEKRVIVSRIKHRNTAYRGMKH